MDHLGQHGPQSAALAMTATMTADAGAEVEFGEGTHAEASMRAGYGIVRWVRFAKRASWRDAGHQESKDSDSTVGILVKNKEAVAIGERALAGGDQSHRGGVW